MGGIGCGNEENRDRNAGNQGESTFKIFKVPRLNKYEKEKDDTEKWRGFSVSLSRFKMDDVSDLKITAKLVLKILMSLRVSQKYGVLQLM